MDKSLILSWKKIFSPCAQDKVFKEDVKIEEQAIEQQSIL